MYFFVLSLENDHLIRSTVQNKSIDAKKFMKDRQKKKSYFKRLKNETRLKIIQSPIDSKCFQHFSTSFHQFPTVPDSFRHSSTYFLSYRKLSKVTLRYQVIQTYLKLTKVSPSYQYSKLAKVTQHYPELSKHRMMSWTLIEKKFHSKNDRKGQFAQ